MKYIIDKNKLEQMIRRFIGPLEKNTDKDGVVIWTNSDGQEIIKFFGEDDIGLNEKFADSIISLFGIKVWEEDDKFLFWKLLEDIVHDIVGHEFEIYMF